MPLTFQKAQEEAITDGLTGVKTHRFLMEALFCEWEALHACRPVIFCFVDRLGPLQVRQRFLWTP